ncbi:RNA-dependent RNA polymerase [Orthobunyavirus tacaiumaense]|uniref:RNA-directed RNA polymerase L n=1 Tax=Orthobunyavirus tacaiumaense TaxID=3052444 RepID=A0A2I4SBU6_9VIRU|nr:RNA-dependent RNA polymerase [Orthobunyavirus tacaiumaense]ASY08211.1 RNA-dependent RNA polymerase [Orthobunyavirus tacaiumaense]
MEYNTIREFRARIANARNADVAKDIDIDLYSARHDYFGRCVCNAYQIEYRNDVPLVDILLDCIQDFDPMSIQVPNITPDNYIYHNNTIFIIDYKVTMSMETVHMTIKKYSEALNKINMLPVNFELVIIQINPRTMELYVSSDLFKEVFGNPPIEADFKDFFDLKDALYGKFENDEEFLLKISHGDFTLTAPWIDEDTPELEHHPEFIFFMNSMDKKYQRLFLDSLNHSAYTTERWNTNLHLIREETKDEYTSFVKKTACEIFNKTGNYSRPDKDSIMRGWKRMTERIMEQRELQDSAVMQKPSGHFIWTPPDSNETSNNTSKILRLSKMLQNITGYHPMLEPLKELGICCDFSEDIGRYESETSRRKEQARKSRDTVKNKKIEPLKIGTSTVLWEQQFSLNTDFISVSNRKRLLKDFCGIGAHKTFSNKSSEDTDLSKPKILDFNNQQILMNSMEMMSKTAQMLKKDHNVEKREFIMEYFGDKIESCSRETFSAINNVQKSRYWTCINDYSMLIKNLLSVSQYNRPNTFRIVTCANNNLFAILLPSVDIKTKRSTIVYFVVALHKDKNNILDPGCLSYTYQSGSYYLSVSKAIRLDKERCQRIVSSPGLFLLSTLIMYNNNPLIDLYDVMAFTFYTSISITKSMLSLTEPARYMIMNSLAISSDVEGYIAEKFSPYTKTLFSVYMTDLIKKACFEANIQREKVTFRDVYLTDFDVTQKGVADSREIKSIWFKGFVSIKEYVNQVYLPFYFNSKGLHEKHHVMIDLIKTVGEIELEQRKMGDTIWSNIPTPQTVNLPIFIHSLAKMLIADTSRHNHLRSKIESKNNFRRSPATVSTFTSSKSCIKVGDFKHLKSKRFQSSEKKLEREQRVANSLFYDDELHNVRIGHATYEDLRNSVPNYTDYITTKNFDRLYELFVSGTVPDDPTIKVCFDMMKNHTQHKFAIFNKGQKTAKDREIFEPQWETKTGMYVIERLSKERCKLNADEMISEPGDNKLRILEQKSEQELRFMLSKNKELTANDDSVPYRSYKLEINADMTKWSAQDVFYKYFWLISMDPVLYPYEKKRILYFMCNYLEKELIIPDEVMKSLLDQRINRADDIFMELTQNFNRNTFKVKRNWLQGNFNYTSSYIHSSAMQTFKEIVKQAAVLLEGDCLVNTLVHSDDNHTSVVIVQNKLTDNEITHFIVDTFKITCLTFGCQANMKKTYFTNFIKEFVSLFNIVGEPFSIYGRFLLTSVGDCAFIGPYEDLSSRISATQSAIKHGCPPSLAWVSIALSHWMTYMTYNMLPNQRNDPTAYFPTQNRKDLPIELFGILDSSLANIALLGMESKNTEFLVSLLIKMNGPLRNKEPISSQVALTKSWDVSKIAPEDLFRLKLLRFFVLDTESTSESIGETSDMRSRSIITPRKFTTEGSIVKLKSYNDYKEIMTSEEKIMELLDYIKSHPELTITKGENMEEFLNMTLFRFNSKRFKESLSIQNPSQLFIEQILFSNKPTIDYTKIREKFISISETYANEEFGSIKGRYTFPESYSQLNVDVSGIKLESEDIEVVYNYCILNDPLTATVANTILLSTIGSPIQRTALSANSMPEFRSMKLIHHSPALVLRCYSANRLDLPGVNPEEMERDIIHILDPGCLSYTYQSGSYYLSVSKASYDQKGKVPENRELTKIYQVCYEYIRSADHKVKIFILPVKTRTVNDFCSVIQGNLISDGCWFTMHYLKQVVVQGHKAVISKAQSNDFLIASECFRVLGFFLDTFVAESFRKFVLQEMIESHSYKNVELSVLLGYITSSQNRQDYLPILWNLKLLTQHDLDKFDAMRSSERISWNDNQINREFNTGPIDLSISGYNREIRIVGEDDKLIVAELKLTSINPDIISNSGRKLLNARHGLKFEKLQRCDVEENCRYITYQKRSHNTYAYQIHSTYSIQTRNTENKSKGRYFNEIVPVCPVIVSKYYSKSKLTMESIEFYNQDNYKLTRLRVDERETIMMKRGLLDRMKLFEGPDINIGLVSLNALSKSTELLTSDYSKLSKVSLISLAQIIECTGLECPDSECEEFDFVAMSDDPMECLTPQDIEMSPALNIYVHKSTSSKLTYRNALNTALKQSIDRFTCAFDFSGEGFYSSKNLGVIATLKSLIELLSTNEWSTIIIKCIHLCMITNKMDAVYHTLDMPAIFVLNPIVPTYDWIKLLKFLTSLPPMIDPFWMQLFNHFIDKSKTMILHYIEEQDQEFQDILENIAVPGGKGDFEF